LFSGSSKTSCGIKRKRKRRQGKESQSIQDRRGSSSNNWKREREIEIQADLLETVSKSYRSSPSLSFFLFEGKQQQSKTFCSVSKEREGRDRTTRKTGRAGKNRKNEREREREREQERECTLYTETQEEMSCPFVSFARWFGLSLRMKVCLGWICFFFASFSTRDTK
jgi:hypothetical protein